MELLHSLHAEPGLGGTQKWESARMRRQSRREYVW